jgi:hypothetical protein
MFNNSDERIVLLIISRPAILPQAFLNDYLGIVIGNGLRLAHSG